MRFTHSDSQYPFRIVQVCYIDRSMRPSWKVDTGHVGTQTERFAARRGRGIPAACLELVEMHRACCSSVSELRD